MSARPKCIAYTCTCQAVSRLPPQPPGWSQGQLGGEPALLSLLSSNRSPHTMQCQWSPYDKPGLAPRQASTNRSYPQALCQCGPHVETISHSAQQRWRAIPLHCHHPHECQEAVWGNLDFCFHQAIIQWDPYLLPC